MRTILLVKTSSLGDVVHNLPVVSDILRAFDSAAIDWVVEKSFAAIPAMHPGVRQVIECELRVWRRAWSKQAARTTWRGFLARLSAQRYDDVIDTQGLLKSAIIARAANGHRAGFDWRSSREPLRFFYDRTFSVPRSQHAVIRNRKLAALALGYEVSGEPDYGIGIARSEAPWLPAAPFCVFLHSSSRAEKLWDEACWCALGGRVAERGMRVVLLWGSAHEAERARRLAARMPAATVAPQLDLSSAAAVLAGAQFVVGVDSGLTHLAAALGIPVVGVFGATDPRATGVAAPGSVANLGSQGRFPSVEEALAALSSFGLMRSANCLQP
jgi:heptosyltransferase-1